MTLDNLKHSLTNFDRDQIFAALGLESRRSISGKAAYALSVAGVGALIGVGVGLMFAPSSGPELRKDLRRRLRAGAPDPHPDHHPTKHLKDGARAT